MQVFDKFMYPFSYDTPMQTAKQNLRTVYTTTVNIVGLLLLLCDYFKLVQIN
uniref:Uncharacterized protein n=1 Tax=Arundo donax TaxID=35708 RepID=A0A0A9EH20_ARUDO